jgi:hypothetical protein
MKQSIVTRLIILGLVIFSCDFIPIKSNYPDQREYVVPKSSAETRTIVFSGYLWDVRTTNGALQGPGPNYFNDSEESVWLDENNYLHLKIRKIEDTWQCAEVYLQQCFGYGMYIFRLSTGFESLDVNTVVGLFTYLDDTHEIDIEYSRWGYSNAENGQFVIQPYSNSGNIKRFTLESNGQSSMHAFYWCSNFIQFRAMYGTDTNVISGELKKDLVSPCVDLINEWIFTGSDNPEPSTERVHINLWLMSGLAPTNEQEIEIVVEEFQFIPMSCEDPLLSECNNIDGFPFAYILLTSFSGIIIIYLTHFRRIKYSYSSEK